MFSTNQKGAIAETAVIHQAVRLGIDVYKPIAEGGRYDFVLASARACYGFSARWAARAGEIVIVRCQSCRRGRRGLIRRRYTAGEIDAFVAYCPDIDRCFFLPIARFPAQSAIQLRLGPTRNNQRADVNWADEYDLVRLDLDGILAGP